MMARRWIAVIAFCAVTVLVALAQTGFAGKWQGETVNGRPVELELKVAGAELTGTFTLSKQTVDISDGKISDKTCSFRIAIEGRTPTVSGELVGEQMRLTVEGVPNPVTLSRVK